MTENEKNKLAKYFYDRFIFLADDRIKIKKSERFKKDYAANPEKYRAQRKRRYAEHLKYLQRPEYKKWKKRYDQQYLSKKKYGEFWESSIALRKLADIVDNRKAKRDQNVYNKSQKRKRNGKNTKRKELESSSVGIYQPR